VHPVLAATNLQEFLVVPAGEAHKMLQHQYQEGAVRAARRLSQPGPVLVPGPPGGQQEHRAQGTGFRVQQ